MNKKKLVFMAMVLCMAAVLAVGGTLAYFKDYDYNTNVMTVGNVKIDQIEKKADGSDYQDGLPMVPVVTYEDGSMDPNNVIDKFVTVKNTGTSDAYIRTLFAFEMGKVWNEETQDYDLIPLVHDYVGIITDEEHSEFGMDFGANPVYIEVQGVPYQVATYYYDANYAQDTESVKSSALEPGETSYPSLQHVFLNSHVGNEFYDMIAGNAAEENRKGEYNILVLSQAVQTEGFDNKWNAFDTAYGNPGDIAEGADVSNAQVWFDTYLNETEVQNEWYNPDHSHDASDDENDVFPEDPVYGAA